MRRRFQSALAPTHNLLLRHTPVFIPFRIILLALVFLAFVFLTFVVGVTSVWAQDASTGALRGSVVDVQGAPVTNADIVAICVETGVRYHTATDVSGRFVVDLLPPEVIPRAQKPKACRRKSLQRLRSSSGQRDN